MNRVLAGLFWIALYLALALSPLVLILLPPRPAPRSFAVELSAALGFICLIQFGLQFLLIARFRRITEPYGIDVILQYHRQMGFAAAGLMLAHALLAVAFRPPLLRALLTPWSAGAPLLTGVAAAFATLLLIVLSVKRRRLGLSYEAWRGSHALLGAAVIVLALAHLRLGSIYVDADLEWTVLVAFAVAMLGVFGYLRVIRPTIEARTPYRVVDVREDRGSTWILTLAPDGHDGMRFLPGQFVWLRVGPGPYNPQEHPFSFSSSAERPQRLEFGIKALGDFTDSIGETLRGTVAYLDGPHGSLSIDRYPAAGYVFIAGGIGVTPFVSMLRTIADRGDRRPCLLIYADDAWENMPFRDDIGELHGRMALSTVYVVENPPPDWDGETGRVTADLLRRRLPDERIQRHYFVCGPNPMITAVERTLVQLGVAPRLIHAERFTLV
jgi:predicted ferric reductase